MLETDSEVRCLTVRQPWATFLATGVKRFETRSWSTRYRGPLAIHASSKFGQEERSACSDPLAASALRRCGYTDPLVELPRGVILAIGVLSSVSRTEELRGSIDVEESAFGCYLDNRFAWELRQVVLLAKPVVARGRLGLWRSPQMGELEVGDSGQAVFDHA
jgi:hypothetical protein